MGVSLRASLAVVAAITVAASAPRAQTSNSGVISGRVVLAKRARGIPPPTNVYSSRAVHRTASPRTSEMRNVVVYVKGVKAPAGSLPVARASVRQEGEFFSPPVLAVTKGSTVEFPNADPFFHNVFSLSRATSFDLGYTTGRGNRAA